MSKVKNLLHVVFSTKERMLTIPDEHREHLYRYIWNELTQVNCPLKRIGGIENHIHILFELNPNLALAKTVGDIKSHSSSWMRQDPRFRHFMGWGRGYYAASVSEHDQDSVIEYIKSQREHHNRVDFNEEMKKLYADLGEIFDDRDLR